MSRKARHLKILEDSKKFEYNWDKPSKKKASLIKIIQESRDDEHKRQANLYAKSLNCEPPNKLRYETNCDNKNKVNNGKINHRK